MLSSSYSATSSSSGKSSKLSSSSDHSTAASGNATYSVYSSSGSSSTSDKKNKDEKNDKNESQSSKQTNSTEETLDDETVENIMSESERIFGLKGFILYYIPLYNKNNKESLKALDNQILSGSFDDAMNSFIGTGDGANSSGAEKITTAIQQFVLKNQKLTSTLPGTFALCYSTTLTDENAARNVIFIPKSTIMSQVQNEQEDASEAQENIDYVSALKEKLNLPPDTLDGSEEQNLVSLLSQTSESESGTSQDIDIEALKEKLGIPSQMEANDVNMNLIAGILNSNNLQEESEIDVE